MIRRKLLQPGIVLSALTAITAMVVSPLALAAGEIEEIIVTASKRAENIQEVSVAVTAIDSEMIERLGIMDITEALADDFLDLVVVESVVHTLRAHDA